MKSWMETTVKLNTIKHLLNLLFCETKPLQVIRKL